MVARGEISIEERLRVARADAVDALLDAERLEAEARKARRRATAKNKHYEDLLLEHGGQMTLPYDEKGGSGCAS